MPVKVPFASNVPRQLHFDTEKLCTQEFYYTPKNSLADFVAKNINERSKSKFGSNLARFLEDKI